MTGIIFINKTFEYDGMDHYATIIVSLTQVISLDNTSPKIDSYVGSFKNVSDGNVLCIAKFKTSSLNYNTPSDMTCYINVEALKVNLNILLDTDSSNIAYIQTLNS